MLDLPEGFGRNTLIAERQACVQHHVVRTIVGTGGLPRERVQRAKVEQEALA